MILEHFGYTHKMQISEEFLVSPEILANDENEKWENVELSFDAIQFLKSVSSY